MSEIETREGVDLDALEALLAKATPGPFDDSRGMLVRAIRGDFAVPLFEPRAPISDPDMPSPTVRFAGRVVFRAGSFDAKHSAAMQREAANLKLVVALLNNAPALIAELRAARTPAQTQTFKDGFDAGLEAAAKVCEDHAQRVDVVQDGSTPRRLVIEGHRAARIYCVAANAIRALKEPLRKALMRLPGAAMGDAGGGSRSE